MLERYGHGGDLLTAEEMFGRPKAQFVDFSSNMNPFGPPPLAERAFRKAWEDIGKYPDPAVRELTRKLSVRYGIPEESILVGNGAAELIDLSIRALAPQTVGIARPSFTEYEEAVRKAGGRTVDIALSERHGFVLQADEAARACERAEAMFLGHPNNPTGRLLSPEILRLLADSGRQILLDEAFIDFCPHEDRCSMIREAAGSDRLFVIRSMTKFYAIPGVRLGFVVAHPDRIRRMRELKVPWSVNGLAQEIGIAVLDDAAYAARTRAWLADERNWLAARLADLGLQVVPSDANFVLFSFPPDSGWTARKAQERLGRRGILIRDASLFPGLNERYVRVAVRLRPDNERLVEEIGRLMAEGEGRS
jgi:threonine-phosphate decarboxylase